MNCYNVLWITFFVKLSTRIQFSDAYNSRTCPEGTQKMGICLHTYLERDFIGLEPYVEPRDGKPLIDGPEIETHCSNLNELVTCYSELDGSCYHLLARMRFSYMLNGLFKLFTWLCGDNEELKVLLENLHCIEQVRRDPFCKLDNIPPNVWQKMLRLEIENDVEICRSIRNHVFCIENSRMMEIDCGRQSQELFLKGMGLWLDNLCIDSASLTHPNFIIFVMPVMVSSYMILFLIF